MLAIQFPDAVQLLAAFCFLIRMINQHQRIIIIFYCDKIHSQFVHLFGYHQCGSFLSQPRARIYCGFYFTVTLNFTWNSLLKMLLFFLINENGLDKQMWFVSCTIIIMLVGHSLLPLLITRGRFSFSPSFFREVSIGGTDGCRRSWNHTHTLHSSKRWFLNIQI